MRAAPLVLATVGLAGLIACGAATEPLLFGGPDASSGADAGDASPIFDSGTALDSAPEEDSAADADAGPQDTDAACDGDAAYDAALCTPPSADRLVANPPVISVAAGSYGVAQFEALGPWASDPNIWISFQTATVPMQFTPYVLQNAPPTGFVFQVAPSTTDVQGTITALGRDGNIERTATLTVTITGCQPWGQAMACQSYDCGFEPDNCGGLVNCGTCSGATPYCFLGTCQAAPPTYCPDGQDLGPGDVCTPCTESRICLHYCQDGRCEGLQDECFCAPWTYPPCPLSAPVDASICDNPGEACAYYDACFNSITSICEPDGTWTTPPFPSCP
jgi:hypothetical protein